MPIFKSKKPQTQVENAPMDNQNIMQKQPMPTMPAPMPEPEAMTTEEWIINNPDVVYKAKVADMLAEILDRIRAEQDATSKPQ